MLQLGFDTDLLCQCWQQISARLQRKSFQYLLFHGPEYSLSSSFDQYGSIGCREFTCNLWKRNWIKSVGTAADITADKQKIHVEVWVCHQLNSTRLNSAQLQRNGFQALLLLLYSIAHIYLFNYLYLLHNPPPLCRHVYPARFWGRRLAELARAFPIRAKTGEWANSLKRVGSARRHRLDSARQPWLLSQF